MRWTRLGLSGLTTFALVLGGAAFTAPANAHGYVNAPESRSIMCKLGKNTNCGAIVYEPQSLEYLKGFPAGGPADGRIASAGGQFGGNLDQQSATRWTKSAITAGPLRFDWTYTAPHNTAKWHYYMTKPGWDVNAPLDRGDLELIGEVAHDGSPANTNPYHTITVPLNRAGYHVILAVWDVSNTVNAFYNVIDVNVIGGPSDAIAPSAPMNLHSMGTTDSTVDLMWNAASDNVGVTGYQVTRNGMVVGTTNKLALTDSNLKPGTSYLYVVRAIDAAGNVSPASNTLSIVTKAAPAADTSPPAAPTYLHSMGTTDLTVDLMWNAATDNIGVTGYQVTRNGMVIGTTNKLALTDSGLKPGTSYLYVVRAIDAAGNVSPASNTLSIATKTAVVVEPVTPTLGTWSATAAYSKGDRVSHNGSSYEAVQTHRGVGDPNWITAQSLWTKLGTATAIAPQPSPQPTSVTAAAWNPTGTYAVGVTATFNGGTYRAVQSHTGVGDPNWIYAPSLWAKI
jgi:chitin-binding protein